MAVITLPNNGFNAGFADGDGGWGDDMNLTLRLLDALVNLRVVDKDLTSPPGSPANGSVYIVGGTGGAWAGYLGQLAIWRAANSGEGVSAGWIFLAPKPGWRAYVIDEKKFYRVGTDSLWVPDSEVDTLVTDSTTARTAQPAQAGDHTRFTNAGTKSYTFDANNSYVPGAEYSGRNVGAGALTLVGANGFTLNPPTSGSLSVPQNSSFVVRIVNSSIGDVAVM